MSNNPLERNYRNHTIVFNPSNMMFDVSGPEFEAYKTEYCRFASYEEATVKIDSEIKKSNELRLKRIDFSVSILTEAGEPVTITDINRGNAEIRGVTGRYIYPNVPGLRAKLILLQRLRKEMNELSDLLEPLRIATSRGYGRIDQEDYPHKLLQLKTVIDEKTKLAQEILNPQPKEEPNTDTNTESQPTTVSVA